MKKLTLIMLAGLVLAGCGDMKLLNDPQPAPRPAPQNNPPGDAAYLGASGVRGDSSEGAVDSALTWSVKHAQISEELLRSQQQRYELEERLRTVENDNHKLKGELDLAHRELSEANQMLVDMRRELEGWKVSVLGFRDEMRQAQRAQMEAMRKVLILLGAEPMPAIETSAASGGTDGN